MYSKILTVRGIAGALTLLACIISACVAHCPARSDTVDFTIDDIVGSWNLVSTVPTSGQNDRKCVTYDITSSPDGFEIEFKARDSVSDQLEIAFGKINMDEDNNGNWTGSIGNEPATTAGPFKHRIVAVEKEEYLVMVTCGVHIDGHARHEAAAILARSGTLSPTKLLELKENLGRFFGSDAILDVDQDCP